MTEEIIKECEFYLPLSENCNEILDSNGNEIYKCSKRQDCYYKKLILLEQENEKLKKEVKQIGSDFIKKGDYARALEQENKALKDNNNHLQVIIDDGRAENKRFREENKELKEKVEVLDKMTGIFSARLCNKYRSALEEIRDYLYTLTTVDSDFPNTETYLRINDKIEEVLNA